MAFLLGNDPLGPFLNARHAVYKERGYANQLPTREELIKLVSAEPNLIRRPIVRWGKRTVIGFDRAALTALLVSP